MNQNNYLNKKKLIININLELKYSWMQIIINLFAFFHLILNNSYLQIRKSKFDK